MGNSQQLMSYGYHLLLISAVIPVPIKISCSLLWEGYCPGGD